jgi:non-ribosomal peptide synthetase component F
VQAQNLALREHEHTPLFDIQRWAERNGEALFDNILVFENYPVSEALAQGAPQELRFGEVHNHEQTNYPLTLLVHLSDELSMHFSYQCDSFAAHSVVQLAGHLQRLLGQMSESGQRSLSELNLIEHSPPVNSDSPPSSASISHRPSSGGDPGCLGGDLRPYATELRRTGRPGQSPGAQTA